MESAELAFDAKRRGEYSRAYDLFQEAYKFEYKAAMLAVKDNAPEPTLSILHRSAASLAMDCNLYREAERLIGFALSGNPPEEIADELRILLEKVNFLRHLELRGIALDPNEFQFTIVGGAVSYGMALMDTILDKFKYIKRLILGTAGRLIGKGFNEINKLNIELYVSEPRASSFAVAFKIGHPREQPLLPTIEDSAANVTKELIDCLDLFNKSEEEQLIEKINDIDYYNDFINAASELIPDGEKIKLVGFTTIQEGVERKVPLTKPIKKIYKIKTDKKSIKILGKLSLGKIVIIDESGKEHSVIIPESMERNILTDLMDRDVIITGIETKKGIKVEDIKGINVINNDLSFYDNNIISSPTRITNTFLLSNDNVRIRCSSCRHEFWINENESKVCPKCGKIVRGPKAK